MNITAQSLDPISLKDLLWLEGTEEEIAAFEEEFLNTLIQDTVEYFALDTLSKEDAQKIQVVLEDETLTVAQVSDKMLEILNVVMPDAQEKLMQQIRDAKKDLLEARIEGIKVFWANNPENMSKIQQAESLLAEAKAVEAVQLLNSISA